MEQKALGPEYPYARAMRRANPDVVDVLVDDPYCYIVADGPGGRVATRYVMPPETRAALETEERGDGISLGTFWLHAPRLALDEAPEP